MTTTTLLKRAAACEDSAQTYDSNDPYKAGVYRGQSQILKEWAGELITATQFVKYHRWYDKIAIVINPIYWFRGNSTYSNRWDKQLIELMNKHHFVNFEGNRCDINGITISRRKGWLYEPFARTDNDVRPSRLTEIRAWRKLRDDFKRSL